MGTRAKKSLLDCHQREWDYPGFSLEAVSHDSNSVSQTLALSVCAGAAEAQRLDPPARALSGWWKWVSRSDVVRHSGSCSPAAAAPTPGARRRVVTLQRLWHLVPRLWRKWLSRRRRGKSLPWPHFTLLLQLYPLPPPVVVHSVYRLAAPPR
jgi:hypothetical protein